MARSTQDVVAAGISEVTASTTEAETRSVSEIAHMGGQGLYETAGEISSLRDGALVDLLAELDMIDRARPDRVADSNLLRGFVAALSLERARADRDTRSAQIHLGMFSTTMASAAQAGKS